MSAGAALDKALADGRWHPLEEVLEAMAINVPPGQAHRRAESERQARAQRHGRPVPRERTRGDEMTSVASGQRKVANDTLGRRIRSGTVERRGDRLRRRMTT